MTEIEKRSKKIGAKIKSIRNAAGLRQAELAEILGITDVTLSRYETGENPIPGLEFFAALSEHFDISPSFFIEPELTKEDCEMSDERDDFMMLLSQLPKGLKAHYVTHIKADLKEFLAFKALQKPFSNRNRRRFEKDTQLSYLDFFLEK